MAGKKAHFNFFFKVHRQHADYTFSRWVVGDYGQMAGIVGQKHLLPQYPCA